MLTTMSAIKKLEPPHVGCYDESLRFSLEMRRSQRSLPAVTLLPSMKTPTVLALASALVLNLSAPAHSEDKKLDMDKAKSALEKLVGEARKAAGKMREDDKDNPLWPRSKETMALPKEDYLKRADSAMKTMDAEIKALAETDSAVNARDYFKTHLESLTQHLRYCRLDAEKLAAVDGEETFRVKQKKFDRSLGFLADNIQLAKEEAGL